MNELAEVIDRLVTRVSNGDIRCEMTHQDPSREEIWVLTMPDGCQFRLGTRGHLRMVSGAEDRILGDGPAVQPLLDALTTTECLLGTTSVGAPPALATAIRCLTGDYCVSWGFQGASGTHYEYGAWPIAGGSGERLGDIALPVGPGSYMFAKMQMTTTGPRWSILYAGQASELGDVLAIHEKEGDAMELGMNFLLFRHDGDKEARVAEVRDLVARFDPMCNRT